MFESSSSSSDSTDDQPITLIHHSTGKDPYYILTSSCFAMGGGDGKFGIWVDEGLLNCVTQESVTFGEMKRRRGVLEKLEIYGFEF